MARIVTNGNPLALTATVDGVPAEVTWLDGCAYVTVDGQQVCIVLCEEHGRQG